jgi:hypothetical protein
MVEEFKGSAATKFRDGIFEIREVAIWGMSEGVTGRRARMSEAFILLTVGLV